MVFHLKRPKRLCRKKDHAGVLADTRKPDLDNLAKSVFDGMVESGVLEDDCLIVDTRLVKVMHAVGERPMAEVSAVWSVV